MIDCSQTLLQNHDFFDCVEYSLMLQRLVREQNIAVMCGQIIEDTCVSGKAW